MINLISSKFRLVLLASLFVQCFLPALAWSQEKGFVVSSPSYEEPGEQSQSIRLQFRTLKAWSGGDSPASGDLGDLSDKLKSLNYEKFELLSTEEVLFEPGSKQSVRLGDGDLLTVKVLYQNPKRVGIWYHWEDASGAELIDSRLHFGCTKPLLTAVDSGDGQGKVLAINLIR